MAYIVQASMASGEISTAVAGRPDLTRYYTALALCYNAFVSYTGGAVSRPGHPFVCEAGDSSRLGRLYGFEFNEDQTYILDFSHETLRFVTGGAQILDSSAVATISGVTEADPAVVTTSGAHGFANGDEVYIYDVAGMTELNGRWFLAANVTGTTFELQDKGGADVDSTGYTTYTSGGSAAPPYEIATPYDEDDLFDLRMTQTQDVLTITHDAYAPRELVRIDNDSWTLSEIEFEPQQAAPTGLSVTVNTTGSVTDRYVVTAENVDSAEESRTALRASVATITGITQAEPGVVTTSGAHGLTSGDEAALDAVVGMTEVNGQRYTVTVLTSTTFSLQTLDGTDVDTSAYTAYTSAGTVHPAHFQITNGATTRDNTISWTGAAGAEFYNVYRRENGVYGFIGRTELTTFEDDNIEPDTSDTPPRFRDPFVGTGDYPAAVEFHDQRRIFGGTTNNPSKAFFTQIGNYYNFSRSSPARDDDGFYATLPARRGSAIMHLVALENLLIMTRGAVWRVTTGQDNDSITPNGSGFKWQSGNGATKLRPLLADDVAMYVSQGQFVRDLLYRYEVDKFNGNDLSVLSRHMFRGKEIVDWAFAKAPHSVVWAPRSDGACLSLTYMREQEVNGWAWHETYGDYESVAVVEEDGRDVVYFRVKRTVGGRTVRWIERQAERDVDSLLDAVCVDAGGSVDSPIAISGMTSAAPVVITTATAHGLTTGDTVDISDVETVDTDETTGRSLSAVNATGYTVTVLTSTTFSLQNDTGDYDGSALPAYVTGGYVRQAIDTVTGAWHLEGESIKVAANGRVVDGLTVTNGSFTLPFKASRIHYGFGFRVRLKSLRLDVPDRTKTLGPKLKRILRLALDFERTLGGKVGPTAETLTEIKWPQPSEWGQPPEWYNGMKRVPMSPKWTDRGDYIIQQDDPLPMTVLSMYPDVYVSTKTRG